MTTIAQTFEGFGPSLVPQFSYQVLAIAARVILAIVLLPVVLLVACLVARDAGFPLIYWVRMDNGSTSPSPRTVKFRTTRIITVSGLERRIVRSKIGRFISRSGLDQLPNIYFGSFKV